MSSKQREYSVVDLAEQIESGLSDEEIIMERLGYLNSEEYKKTIGSNTSRSSNIISGFIGKDQVVEMIDESRLKGCTKYIIDEQDIYKELLKYVRDNFDREKVMMKRNLFPILILYKMVREYMDSRDDAKYKELVEGMKTQLGDSEDSKKDIRALFGGTLNVYLAFLRSRIDIKQSEFYRLEEIMESISVRVAENKEVKELTEEERKVLELFLNVVKSEKKKLDEIRREPIKLSDIKHLGLGRCTEHASLCQNLLSFLGYNVFLVHGEIEESGTAIPHTFNIFEKDGNFYLYDASLLADITGLEGVLNYSNLLNFSRTIEAQTLSGEKLLYRLAAREVDAQGEGGR